MRVVPAGIGLVFRVGWDVVRVVVVVVVMVIEPEPDSGGSGGGGDREGEGNEDGFRAPASGGARGAHDGGYWGSASEEESGYYSKQWGWLSVLM